MITNKTFCLKDDFTKEDNGYDIILDNVLYLSPIKPSGNMSSFCVYIGSSYIEARYNTAVDAKIARVKLLSAINELEGKAFSAPPKSKEKDVKTDDNENKKESV